MKRIQQKLKTGETLWKRCPRRMCMLGTSWFVVKALVFTELAVPETVRNIVFVSASKSEGGRYGEQMLTGDTLRTTGSAIG